MGKPTYTNTGVTIGNLAAFDDRFGNIKDSGIPASTVGASTGTVTSVSMVTANGVSGSVANPNTTPAITVSLGAITPSSVAATGAITGSNLSGTNTGDNTAISQTLTGFVANAGTVTSSDTVLTGMQKVAGNIALLSGAIVFQGTWNASTNTPTLTSSVGTKGYMYTCSVAGTTSLDGINSWNVGDQAVFNGSVWQKIDGVTNEVISVAGRTGAVTLSFTDISGTATSAQIPTATTSAIGGVKPDGSTITISGGVISAAASSPFTSGTWASRPSSPSTGQLYFATDLGTGVMIIYTGSKWKPLTGSAVLGQSGAEVSTSSSTFVSLASILVPAGLLSTNGRVRIWAAFNQIAASGLTAKIDFSSVSGTAQNTIINSSSSQEYLILHGEVINSNSYGFPSQSGISQGTNSYSGPSVAAQNFAFNTSTTAAYVNLFAEASSSTSYLVSYCVEWLEP